MRTASCDGAWRFAYAPYAGFNPVKHGLVDHAADWPFSPFHRCVAAGLYPADWSVGGAEPADRGERR